MPIPTYCKGYKISHRFNKFPCKSFNRPLARTTATVTKTSQKQCLNCQTTTFCACITLTSLTLLHNYNMKIPSFFLNNTITTNNNLFRCQNLTALHEINSKEIHPHLPLSATSNKHNNIWKSINSILFKVTLSQPSPFSILKFPFTIFCQLLAVKCLPGILHFAWPWTCSNPSCQQNPLQERKTTYFRARNCNNNNSQLSTTKPTTTYMTIYLQNHLKHDVKKQINCQIVSLIWQHTS